MSNTKGTPKSMGKVTGEESKKGGNSSEDITRDYINTQKDVLFDYTTYWGNIKSATPEGIKVRKDIINHINNEPFPNKFKWIPLTYTPSDELLMENMFIEYPASIVDYIDMQHGNKDEVVKELAKYAFIGNRVFEEYPRSENENKIANENPYKVNVNVMSPRKRFNPKINFSARKDVIILLETSLKKIFGINIPAKRGAAKAYVSGGFLATLAIGQNPNKNADLDIYIVSNNISDARMLLREMIKAYLENAKIHRTEKESEDHYGRSLNWSIVFEDSVVTIDNTPTTSSDVVAKVQFIIALDNDPRITIGGFDLSHVQLYYDIEQGKVYVSYLWLQYTPWKVSMITKNISKVKRLLKAEKLGLEVRSRNSKLVLVESRGVLKIEDFATVNEYIDNVVIKTHIETTTSTKLVNIPIVDETPGNKTIKVFKRDDIEFNENLNHHINNINGHQNIGEYSYNFHNMAIYRLSSIGLYGKPIRNLVLSIITLISQQYAKDAHLEPKDIPDAFYKMIPQKYYPPKFFKEALDQQIITTISLMSSIFSPYSFFSYYTIPAGGVFKFIKPDMIRIYFPIFLYGALPFLRTFPRMNKISPMKALKIPKNIGELLRNLRTGFQMPHSHIIIETISRLFHFPGSTFPYINERVKVALLLYFQAIFTGSSIVVNSISQLNRIIHSINARLVIFQNDLNIEDMDLFMGIGRYFKKAINFVKVNKLDLTGQAGRIWGSIHVTTDDIDIEYTYSKLEWNNSKLLKYIDKFEAMEKETGNQDISSILGSEDLPNIFMNEAINFLNL